MAAVPRGLILAFAALAFVRGMVWSTVLPPWYGPDEITHFDYVQVLAVEGQLPHYGASRDDGFDVPFDVRCSGQHLGFGSGNGPFLAHPLPAGQWSCPVPPADVLRPVVATTPAAAYTPFYYALAVPFWWVAAQASVEQRDHAVRLLSVLLGTVAAVFALLAAWEAFAGARGPAVAAALVFTLQPMSAQQFAIANNDALLAALAAAFFWLLFRVVRRGPTPREVGILGALVGLAYLAKPQGIFLAAGLLVPLWQVLRSNGGVAWLRATALGVAPVALAIGVAGTISLLAQGSVLPQAATQVPGHHSLHDYLALMTGSMFSRTYWLLVVSVWGDFGWVNAHLPRVMYAIAAVLSGIGLLAAFLVRSRVMTSALLTVLAVGAATIALEAVTYRATGVLPLQGRSFLQLLVPMSILAVAGLESLFRPFWAPSGRLAITGFALLANLLAIGGMTVAYFG